MLGHRGDHRLRRRHHQGDRQDRKGLRSVTRHRAVTSLHVVVTQAGVTQTRAKTVISLAVPLPSNPRQDFVESAPGHLLRPLPDWNLLSTFQRPLAKKVKDEIKFFLAQKFLSIAKKIFLNDGENFFCSRFNFFCIAAKNQSLFLCGRIFFDQN